MGSGCSGDECGAEAQQQPGATGRQRQKGSFRSRISRFFWDLEFGYRVNEAREGPIPPEGPTLSKPRASSARGPLSGLGELDNV
ncbi:unnamed protein product [Sphagnum tenellum]